jgi:NAD(P)H-hydrate repair Nnr-like enzyme with NAD(P)H-hydrate dehydratase domain
MDHDDRDAATEARCREAVAQSLPTVLDGGALDLVGDVTGPVVITPHFRELARVWLWRAETAGRAEPAGRGELAELTAQIAASPAEWSVRVAEEWGVTVLLKGHQTWVAAPGFRFVARSAPSWLATAGAGDALGGILGALVATHATQAGEGGVLARLAATAALVHGIAADRASAGGPLTILDLAAEVSRVVAELVAAR